MFDRYDYYSPLNYIHWHGRRLCWNINIHYVKCLAPINVCVCVCVCVCAMVTLKSISLLFIDRLLVDLQIANKRSTYFNCTHSHTHIYIYIYIDTHTHALSDLFLSVGLSLNIYIYIYSYAHTYNIWEPVTACVIKLKNIPLIKIFTEFTNFAGQSICIVATVSTNGSGDRGFNPRSSHTKDSKNGTWCLLA